MTQFPRLTSFAREHSLRMATANTKPVGVTLTLTGEEHGQLPTFRERALRDKLIEEHRTDALSFKEFVRHQEAILQSVIDTLRSP